MNVLYWKIISVFLSMDWRSYLDMAKVLVFRYMFWFVLSVLFVTGATRISVFGLGYLMACFFFLLFGTRLLIKPSRTRLVLWDCLIIYNVAVIISKNILSVSEQPYYADWLSHITCKQLQREQLSYNSSVLVLDPGLCVCVGDAEELLLGNSALQSGVHSQRLLWP